MEALATEFHRSRRYQPPFALFTWEHQSTVVTVSIGVVMLSSEIDQIETLVTPADQAMYYAKHRGRSRVELYSEACASEDQLG